MTKRIRLAYGSLSPRSKVAMTIAVVFMLLISFMLVASASSITFSNLSPTATVQVSKPTVSVDVYSPDIVVTQSNTSMTLGLSSSPSTVSPNITSAGGGVYKLAYTPVSPLKNGTYTVDLSVYGTAKTWNFAVDAAPNVIGRSPAAGAALTTNVSAVSLTVRDTYNNLDANSVAATLSTAKGAVPVTVSFAYKQNWGYDSCGTPYLISTDYKEGTVTLNTGKLPNGEYTAQVKIKDSQGNELVETWTFSVNVSIKFRSASPSNGSTTGSATPKIYVQAYDGSYSNGSDNPVIMLVDGNRVSPTVDSITNGYAIHFTPTEKLTEGSHTATVKVFDTYLNKYVEYSWSFIVDSTPKASNRSPVTTNTSSPTISLYVKDTFNDLNATTLSVKVDGQPVSASIKYDSYDGGSCVGTVTIYSAGTITARPTGLINGNHTVEVRIADNVGNVMVETWTVSVKQPPQFTVSPANGTKNASLKQLKATIRANEPNSFNWTSVPVALTVNGSAVTSYTLTPSATDHNQAELVYNYTFPDNQNNTATVEATVNSLKGTASWTFLTDSTPPTVKHWLYRTDEQMSGVYGTVHSFDGLVITNGMLRFTGELNDKNKIQNNLTVVLKGTELPSNTPVETPLPVTFKYRGRTDSCTGQWIVTDTTTAYISYSGLIRDGDYQMSMTYEDELGNKRTSTVTFQVRTPPVMSSLTPLKYGEQQLRPEISAIVRDINGTIIASTIQLTLNGSAVPHAYDATTGKVSYTPAEDLADESYHTLVLRATDDQGLVTTRTWKFYTNENNYADMADSNYTNCTSCHTVSNPSNALESSMHNRLEFYGDHGADCDDCHNFVTVIADCVQCHESDYGANDYAPHGSTPSISYSVMNYDKLFPIRVKNNREMFDCVICHQPGVPLRGYEGAWANPTRYVDSHDLPDLHKVGITADNESCVNCHAKTLTREHAREGRLDANGLQITCNTCHKSSDPLVQSAITNKNKDCSACHEQADHESLHTNTMDGNCATCHSGTLTTEHMNNTLTTGGKGYDCNTCHNSTRRDVNRTIAQNRLNCTGCHTSGHDVYFADDVPTEVPLYSGFTWTTPLDSVIFSGEATAPAGYELGQVVMTNRSSHATATQIWDYYYSTLVTTNGWTLKSGTAPTSNVSFKAEYGKGTSNIYIFCYNTVGRDGSGTTIGGGYRIELWYK